MPFAILCVLVAILVSALLIFLIRLFMKCSIRKCKSKASMVGKVVIVTGANAGIGYQTVLDLARRGAKVILACRSEDRGTSARDNIIAETGNNEVIFKRLNLSSLKSVKEFAEDVKNNVKRLDVLINNAGVHVTEQKYTDDGILEAMQINHFAPFLLTLLLLPMIKQSKGRIVNLSSICHFRGEVNLDKINKAYAYNGDIVYANSKLCNILFTKELARRLSDNEVTVNAVHPGVIRTAIVKDDVPLHVRILFDLWCWFCCRNVEEGAQTSIYLAVAEEVTGVSGKYFIDCSERFVFWRANDKKLAADLWEYSRNIVGLKASEISDIM